MVVVSTFSVVVVAGAFDVETGALVVVAGAFVVVAGALLVVTGVKYPRSLRKNCMMKIKDGFKKLLLL